MRLLTNLTFNAADGVTRHDPQIARATAPTDRTAARGCHSPGADGESGFRHRRVFTLRFFFKGPCESQHFPGRCKRLFPQGNGSGLTSRQSAAFTNNARRGRGPAAMVAHPPTRLPTPLYGAVGLRSAGQFSNKPRSTGSAIGILIRYGVVQLHGGAFFQSNAAAMWTGMPLRHTRFHESIQASVGTMRKPVTRQTDSAHSRRERRRRAFSSPPPRTMQSGPERPAARGEGRRA